jgi:teichuronic acid biosynthesis glycosyltransferase TuaG
MIIPVDSNARVCVVITAYNSQHFIGEALDSVRSQTFTQWEAIVVDDNSTDKTTSIVERYSKDDSRISLIRSHQRSGGPAAGRNRAVAATAAEWVAFLDADDVWHPQKLEAQMGLIRKAKARFVCTEMTDFSDAGHLKFKPIPDVGYASISFFSQLIKFKTPTSSVFVDRALLRRFPFNEHPSYVAREDLDCWLHCLEASGPGAKIPFPLVGYRLSGSQISLRKTAMLKRHFHVLRNYQMESGRKLGTIKAASFTTTHFLLSVVYRKLLKKL